MIFFQDHLDFLAQVTRALNHLGAAPDGMYIKVALVEAGADEEVLGEWCDEFGEDNWYFDTDTKKDK
ncbi:hypothetical protein JRC04_05270 [Mycolicibacterium sp. S2-37]|uniref:hypothetical protein n=1 Tax=Mycolicibacterium sp. S2-37 TaxID=2810297 RepID=UPI001A93AF9B|nr:hypothetical protein [Mycolicibacterium sp. S2-37]MBO0676865.1 hypothetical protein [Mycolicibacterium sp. S2-37]